MADDPFKFMRQLDAILKPTRQVTEITRGMRVLDQASAITAAVRGIAGIETAFPNLRWLSQFDRSSIEAVLGSRNFAAGIASLGADGTTDRIASALRIPTAFGSDLLPQSSFAEQLSRAVVPYTLNERVNQWESLLGRHLGPIQGFLRAAELAEEYDDDGEDAFDEFEHDGRFVLPANEVDLAALQGLPLAEAQRLAQERTKWIGFQVLQRVLRNPLLMREIDPRDFEKLTAEILDKLGFINVTLTPPSGDGGIDVIATHVAEGIPFVVYFQCKRYGLNTPVTLTHVRALLGVALDEHRANKAVLVTSTRFTKGERELLTGRAMLDGKDYDDVVGWLKRAWPEGAGV